MFAEGGERQFSAHQRRSFVNRFIFSLRGSVYFGFFLSFAPCPGRAVWRIRHAAGAKGNNSNEANRNNYDGSERNAGNGRNWFRGKDSGSSGSSGSSSSNEMTTNARSSVKTGNNRLRYKKKADK